MSMQDAKQKTKNGRSKVLADAASALAAANAAAAVSGSAAPAGGIDLAISMGASSNQSNTVQNSTTSAGSTVAAGGNTNIIATGAGANSNLTIAGSEVSGTNINLKADNQINLIGQRNSNEEHSTNKGSSASIGISFGSSGFMVNASASGSRGMGDGSDSDVTNTHIKAVNQLAMTSGGDTNIKGATASGKQVTANVGGNLNVESLQDSSQYKSQQQSLGGSVSVGVGKVSGSISASRSKVDGNYQSVTEQSGILAGDDGFKVAVNGNTDLKGAKIASTDKAVADNKNSFTTASLTNSDIQNKSDYKAESQSFSAGGGYGGGKTAMNGTGIGFGKDSGSASSTTTSGVSGIAGDKTVRSDKDNSNALKKTWNGKELQQDVEAQAKISEAFGKEAAKGIGTYATSKLNALKDQIKAESDPAKKAALQNEAKNWDEGGVYRTTLHAAAGALGGGVGGALGATASSVAMPAIAEQIKKMDAPDAVKLALAQVAAAAIGAAVGGNAGLASSVSVEANNRQLHEDGKAKEKTLAKKLAEGSSGKYTQAQIEDALRSANNNKLGETASTGAVVPYDAKTNFTIYDKTGMMLGKAPDGSPVLMQNPAMLATPSSDLQAYIKNSTGNTYSWNTVAPQLSGTPSAGLPSIMPGTVTPEMLANRKIYAVDATDKLSTGTGLAAIWAPPPFDLALAGLSGVFKGTNYLLSPPSPASALLDSTFTVLPIFLPQTKFVQTGFGMGAAILQPIITPYLDNSLNQATTCSPPKKC